MNVQASLKLDYKSTVAVWLSRVFHPFTVSMVTLFLIAYLSGETLEESLKWTVLSFAVAILPALVLILVRFKTGQYSDLDVSIREQRHGLYILTMICFGVLLIILNVGDAPRIVLGCFYAATIAVVVGAVINRFYTKVSLHSVAVAGCASSLFYVSPIGGIILAFITLLVGWSRVHLKRHTATQVVLGWFIAATCVWIVFSWFL